VKNPESFNPDNLRLPGNALQEAMTNAKAKPPRHRQGEKFLSGPIPWPWVHRASQLKGKALTVALVLWQEAGCRKCRTIRFRPSQTDALGFHRSTARRGLRALEQAGLVRIRRIPGQCLEVTILEAPLSAPNAAAS
jgi:hypothetical protein